VSVLGSYTAPSILKAFVKSSEVNLKQALLIGLAQGFAVLPGFSRSGWTIATGLFLGLDRESSARYSFLLSIPIILGASMVYPLVEIDVKEVVTYNWLAIIVGTIVSGVVGYLCIKYFMKFISKFSLNVFGYYCVIMGFFTLVFFNIFK
jgi:undecaprenyl-diphosphatase